MTEHAITLFTKPWPETSVHKLAEFVKSLGLNGVELPVRPGYQVTPETVGERLAEAARIFAEFGLKIGSVAGPLEEATIEAMGEAGVPILRICVGIDMGMGYKATEDRVRRQFDELLPILDRHGVSIGVQNHCDLCVGSAIGIMHLIERYDPKYVCAVLDQAHCGVDGEPEEMALDIVWSHLRLVNFKSAFRRRTNGPDAEEAAWEIYWTTCHHAGYSWRKMVSLLKQRDYMGDLCLPAEYSGGADGGILMGRDAVPMLVQDIAYLKKLLGTDITAPPAAGTDWESGVGKRRSVTHKDLSEAPAGAQNGPDAQGKNAEDKE